MQIRKIRREFEMTGAENETALVSVIIPVYKIEDYLDVCVQSVIGQT